MPSHHDKWAEPENTKAIPHSEGLWIVIWRSKLILYFLKILLVFSFGDDQSQDKPGFVSQNNIFMRSWPESDEAIKHAFAARSNGAAAS